MERSSSRAEQASFSEKIEAKKLVSRVAGSNNELASLSTCTIVVPTKNIHKSNAPCTNCS